MTLSLVGTIHVAIQLPLYEAMKSALLQRKQAAAAAVAALPLPGELSAPELIAASAVSKMVASTITYPHEVRM